MDFTLTDAQGAVRDLAWEILGPRAPGRGDGRVPPVGEGWPDRTAWERLADANLLGIALAEDVGGSGQGLVALGLLLEQVGRAAARVPARPTLTTAVAVDALGSDRQRGELLPGVVAGETVLTAALTEPDGSDPEDPGTTAAPDGEGWRLTGRRPWVPSARAAERILVPATADDGTVVLALVAPDAAGVTLTAQETTDGSPRAEVGLDGTPVGPAAVVAADDGGALRWLADRARVAVSAELLGVSERALRMTADHTSQREQFGRPLATFQSVAVQAADGYIDVEAMRATLWQALWRLEVGRDARQAVTVARWWAAEAGERVASAAMHLHGGIGVDTDYPLHHYFLRAKALELTLGSGASELDRLGAQLAGAGAER